MRILVTTLLAVGAALATRAGQSFTPREIVGHVLKPTEAPPPAVGTLKVVEGFRVRRFAENLGQPRMLALAPEGGLYVTLLRAKPSGESRTIFASGLRNTIGFGWHPTTGAPWGMDHGIDWLGDEIVAAITGHVVAGGETIGTFAAASSAK